VAYGGNADALSVPAKTGYTGVWNHDGQNITADTDIAAVYTLIEYTISFNLGYGGTQGAVTYTVETQAVAVPAPAGREGYAFEGWYADAAFGQKADGAFLAGLKTAPRDLTLYAKWADAPTGKENGLSPGAIAGIVVGSVAVAGGVALAVFLILAKRKKRI
jgi:uncharacterized repeat protein (TIGR02543 family)